MSVDRRTRIDVELESVGQFDRTERWVGKLDVTRQPDGRVRIGHATQGGFQALLFDPRDLTLALADGSPEHSPHITTAHRVYEKDGGIVVDPPVAGAHIFINRLRYGNLSEPMSGTALRLLPNPPIPDDYDLWEEREIGDRLIDREDILKLGSGERFYTTPSSIMAGSPEHSTGDEQWAVQAMQGVRLIAAERERQVAEEGWTADHDDRHRFGELRQAAKAYANDPWTGHDAPSYWPFEMASWKPSNDLLRNLAKAGALIAAEIDRLQRAGLHERRASEHTPHDA